MRYPNHFRFYLARHTNLGFRAIGNYVTNTRRVAASLGAGFELLLALPEAQPLQARIYPTDPAFVGENPDTLADCRAAVARYHEFRQWRRAQS